MKHACLAVMLALTLGANGAAEHDLVCGAYIGQNSDHADEIREYEHLCGIENSIYLISVKNVYPRRKVLECYANGKIPMLLVSDSYGMGKVSALAEEAAEYNMPMYVCINGSLEFYRYCAGMFRIKAKNAKLVQAVALSDYSYEFAGVDIVDYLAINATVGAGSVNYPYLYNMIENADVPVMIDLAVSHYSDEGHRYYIYDAVKILDYIYNMKGSLGEKLYAVNYINVKYKGQRFEVYNDEKLRTIYAGKVCEWGGTGGTVF